MNETGLFSWFGYEQPFPERIALIAEAGFTSTCLWLEAGEKFVACGRREELPEIARKAGLYVDNVHATFEHCNALWEGSEEGRDVVRAEYEDAMLYCRRHGIPIVVAHITKGPTPPPMNDRGLDVLRDLAVFAEHSGVIFAIENTGWPDYIDFALSNIESPGLGFCYDSSHDFLPFGTFGKLLDRWGGRLVATHFSDNAGADDDHWLPWEGSIDWVTVKRCFPTQTYSGRVMLEAKTKNPDTEPPEEFVRRAYDTALRLHEMLRASA